MNLFYQIFIKHLNFLYQKIKYDKNYLTEYPKDEINKHKKNFYKKKIYSRSIKKNFKNFNFFKIKFSEIALDNSMPIDQHNPLVKTAKQLIKNPDLKFKKSHIFFFFSNFKPQNFAEIYGIKNSKFFRSLSPYTSFYPWLHKYPQRFLVPGMFGPKNQSYAYSRFIRLKNLIKLISEYGYIFDKSDIVSGYFLIKNKNNRKFIITAGAHRCAVIRALNKNAIYVAFDKYRVKYEKYKLSQINSWPSIKSNFISKIEAKKMFETFFKK
jgi:hypothetical protein